MSHTCQGRDGKGDADWSSKRETGGGGGEVENRCRASFGTRVCKQRVSARIRVVGRLIVHRLTRNMQQRALLTAE